MSTTTKAAPPQTHTPGALRAGRNISARFRKALSHLPETNAETLAEIIDAETGAKELLEALEKVKAWFVKLEDGTEDDDPLRAIRKKYHAPVHAIIDAAIAKARGRQL